MPEDSTGWESKPNTRISLPRSPGSSDLECPPLQNVTLRSCLSPVPLYQPLLTFPKMEHKRCLYPTSHYQHVSPQYPHMWSLHHPIHYNVLQVFIALVPFSTVSVTPEPSFHSSLNSSSRAHAQGRGGKSTDIEYGACSTVCTRQVDRSFCLQQVNSLKNPLQPSERPGF